MIDCCQSYSLDYLSEHYVKKANNKLVQWLTIRCYDLVTDRTSEMNLDNTSNNLHLLRSTMNFKLCHGDIVVASQKGNNTCIIAVTCHQLFVSVQGKLPCQLLEDTMFLYY